MIIANDYGMGSHSHLGYTYIPIVGAYGSSEAKSYLAGAYNFAVKEMEVFSVEFEWFRSNFFIIYWFIKLSI